MLVARCWRLVLVRHAHAHEARGSAALRLRAALRAAEDDEARGGQVALAPLLELQEAVPGEGRDRDGDGDGAGEGRVRVRVRVRVRARLGLG